jgi:hypothetical protein
VVGAKQAAGAKQHAAAAAANKQVEWRNIAKYGERCPSREDNIVVDRKNKDTI